MASKNWAVDSLPRRHRHRVVAPPRGRLRDLGALTSPTMPFAWGVRPHQLGARKEGQCVS